MDLLPANGTIKVINTVRTTAENLLCSNSTTPTSLHSKQHRLQMQFWINQLLVHYLEEETNYVILLFITTQTSIPVHLWILAVVIRILYTFMRMLIHMRDFQELKTLWSRIMKSGELPLNDQHLFLYFIEYDFLIR